MPTCFIIQPFDGAAFDKRYKDVVGPAIRDAGLDPYRVDQDPSVNIPIEQIEKGIRDSALCLAEISTDNPNVWFELGYAIACNKSVILVCSDERTKFPFDVQHRSIIRYSKESPSDFVELGHKITLRARALLEKDTSLQTLSLSTDLAPVEGLNQQEMAVLVSLAGSLNSPTDNLSSYALRREIEKSGFTKMAAIIGIKSLSSKGLIDYRLLDDERGNPYEGYFLTEEGWKWVMNNTSRFKMTVEKSSKNDSFEDVPF